MSANFYTFLNGRLSEENLTDKLQFTPKTLNHTSIVKKQFTQSNLVGETQLLFNGLHCAN